MPKTCARIARLAPAILLFPIALVGCGEKPQASAPATPGIATEDDVLAILKSANSFRGLQELAKADAILASAVQKYPQDRAIRLAYGDLLVEMREEARAYEQFKEGLGLQAGGEGVQSEVKDLVTAGMLATSVGKPTEAVAWFEQAEQRDPGNGQAMTGLANAWLAQQEFAKAKAVLLRAVAIDEANSLAWGMLGEIELRENHPEKAAEFAGRARELDPGQVAWRIAEGRAHLRLGQAPRTVELLMGLPPADAYKEEAVRLLAEAYGQMQRPQDAYALYEKAMEAHRGEAAFIFQTALWAERAGQMEQAKRWGGMAAMLGHPGASDLVARLKKAELADSDEPG